jgi:hypothetical protein
VLAAGFDSLDFSPDFSVDCDFSDDGVGAVDDFSESMAFFRASEG